METLKPAPYFDRDFQVEAVKLLPGQYHVCGPDGSMSTVLGSCVSTCLWDPQLRLGGMNHFMLPGEGALRTSAWAVSARFGVYAMELLINEMLRRGAERRRMVAKVFGGARVLQGFDTLDVGAKNSEFVLDFLREEGIPLAAQDLQGVHPRKVHFFSDTGKVHMKRLPLQSDDTVHRQEREYFTRLARGARGGDVELFSRPG